MAHAVQSITEALDNLYTTTWKHMKGPAADNIFDATPFWAWLRDKGKLVKVEGGRQIERPLVYAKNENVKFIGRGGTVALNDYEFLTDAVYKWKYLIAPLVRFGQDDQQNRGKMRIMSLLENKLENAQLSLEDTLESQLFADEAQEQEFDGLQHLVSDDGIGTVGGIDANVEVWWKNKFKTMASSIFSANGIPNMRTMLNDVSQNKAKDRPDLILTGQQPYEFYEEAAFDKLELHDTKMAELGFESQKFKGITMVWSPSCGLRMYFLNSRFLEFIYDPAMFFDMTEWKPIPEQVNDRAAQIATACAFTTNRRRAQGVIFSIDTA